MSFINDDGVGANCVAIHIAIFIVSLCFIVVNSFSTAAITIYTTAKTYGSIDKRRKKNRETIEIINTYIYVVCFWIIN